MNLPSKLPSYIYVKQWSPQHMRVMPHRVEVKCGICGKRTGRLVYGSIHVYFYCYDCEIYTDLGIRWD